MMLTDDGIVHRRPRIRAWLGRAFARFGLFCILAVLAVVCYLYFAGLPFRTKALILRRISTQSLAVESDFVGMGAFSGFTLREARVYRKGVTGPPLLTAARIDVMLDPFALISGSQPLRGIRIEGGALCQEMTGRSRTTPPAARHRPGRGTDTKSLGTKPEKVSLDLELIDCALNSVEIQSLFFRLNIEGESWSVEKMDGAIAREGRKGLLNGSFAYDRDENILQGNFTAKMNPRILLPCFEAWKMPGTVRLVNRFDFGEYPLRCEAEFSRSLEPGGRFQSQARLWIEESQYRGIAVDQANAKVYIRSEAGSYWFSLDPLQVTRPEGDCRVRFDYDRRTRELTFEGHSTIDHKALTGMIGILTSGQLDPFDPEGSSFASGAGSVNFQDRLKTDFEVKINSERIRFKNLVGEDCSFGVRMRGTTNWIDNFEANLGNGRLEGNAAFFFDPVAFTNTGYRVKLNIADASCSDLSLIPRKGQARLLEGKLSGWIDVNGGSGTNALENMSGSGKVFIRDGRVFSLPLFGGFSQIMAKIIPGLDFVLRQTDASASFTIADGVIRSDEVHIKGDILSLSGHGTCSFNGELDFTVRVSLMKEHTLVAKMIAPLMYPISKLFEFRLRGTIDEPDWYPTNFSRDMLRRIGLLR